MIYIFFSFYEYLNFVDYNATAGWCRSEQWTLGLGDRMHEAACGGIRFL